MMESLYHCRVHSQYSHDGLPLGPRAQVPLDLGLVDSIQSQHEEDPPHGQRPEGVALQGVGVQAVQAQVRCVNAGCVGRR